MKNPFRKPRSRRGETLVEILVSILIIALSAGLFAAMYMASMNINLSAREQDDLINQTVSDLESKKGEGTKGALSFEVKDGEKGSLNVDIYSENGLVTYAETEKTP